jgi:hypothetical protein
MRQKLVYRNVRGILQRREDKDKLTRILQAQFLNIRPYQDVDELSPEDWELCLIRVLSTEVLGKLETLRSVNCHVEL